MIDSDIIKKFENIAYRLKTIQGSCSCDNSDFFIDTLHLAETSALKLRDIYFCFEKSNCYYESITKKINISIEYITEKEMYKITLPGLLSKKKYNLNSFIFDPVYYLLLNSERNNKLKKFDRATFCFVHNYVKTSVVSDYDNLESKRLIDLLASFFIPDDNGKYFSQMNLTRISNKNMTEVYIFDSKYTDNIIFKILDDF